MNYFTVAITTIGLVALITKFSPSTLGEKVLSRCNDRTVLWIAALVFVVTLGVAIFKHEAMLFGLWDFGIYDSMMHLAVNGGKFMQDFRGSAYDHFSPVVFLLVPFYAICDTPYILIIAQTLILASAGPVLFLLARRYFPKGPIPLLLTVAYFLNPYYSRMAYFDFHSETLFPLFFFSAFLLRAKGRHIWFMIVLLATPLIKEDFVVPLGAVGLYFLFCKNHRKMGIILIAGAILWTFFVLKVYFPWVSDKGFWHYDRYEFTQENILIMFKKIFSLHSLAILLSLLIPFGFFSGANWKFFLFVVMPTVGVQLVSTSLGQNFLRSHYSSALIAVVPVAALWGIRTIRQCPKFRPNFKKIGIFATLLMLLAHFVFTEIAISRYYTYIPSFNPKFQFTFLGLPLDVSKYAHFKTRYNSAQELQAITSQIPQGVSIMAQNELGCHLLRTHKVTSAVEQQDVDFYLFSKDNYYGFDALYTVNYYIYNRTKDPNFHIWCQYKGVLIISRKEFPPLTGAKPE